MVIWIGNKASSMAHCSLQPRSRDAGTVGAAMSPSFSSMGISRAIKLTRSHLNPAASPQSPLLSCESAVTGLLSYRGSKGKEKHSPQEPCLLAECSAGRHQARAGMAEMRMAHHGPVVTGWWQWGAGNDRGKAGGGAGDALLEAGVAWLPHADGSGSARISHGLTAVWG